VVAHRKAVAEDSEFRPRGSGKEAQSYERRTESTNYVLTVGLVEKRVTVVLVLTLLDHGVEVR
jgi:hypothetical protein